MTKDHERMIEAMSAYNYRRWIAWIMGSCSLIAGSYTIANAAGALVGFGLLSIAVAISQEIRAGIFPVGCAAINELGREPQN